MLHVAAFNGFLFEEQRKTSPVALREEKKQASVPQMHGNRLSALTRDGDCGVEVSSLSLHSLDMVEDNEGFEMTTFHDLPQAPAFPHIPMAAAGRDRAHELLDC